ncbi:MAG TPA: DNA gyrase inhibitor YacG [Terriglobales bacterium]|jgi:hypothetical protein
MARKLALKLQCPICKKGVKKADPDFPFCSERCRSVDLGKWASGAYVVSSPVTDGDEEAVESILRHHEEND